LLPVLETFDLIEGLVPDCEIDPEAVELFLETEPIEDPIDCGQYAPGGPAGEFLGPVLSLEEPALEDPLEEL
jgi:hypothetical protein